MTQQYNMVSSGWDVFGSDGEKIGTVDEVGQDYLLVRKGLIFTTDVYVPHDAITQIDADQTAAFISVPKDAIDSQGWNDAPMSTGSFAGETTTDEGYMATSTQTVGNTGYDATDYSTTDRTTDYNTTEQTTDSDTIRVPRYEEELRAGKETVEAGEVEVRKNVVEEQRTIDVPVTREDVEVRRVSVNREASAADDAAFTQSGDTLRVPIREEQVVVSKEPRVVEELEIRKVATQDTEQVSDTVRREEVDVQRTGSSRTVSGDQHDHDLSNR